MIDKKKIYILHGWAYDTNKWKPFIEELDSKKINVEMLKIPGLTAPLDKVWDLDTYVEWLKKIVGNNKVILLGHSNGGRIGLAFAAKYPELVSQLILIDSAAIFHNELPVRLKRLIFGTIAKVGKIFTNAEFIRVLLYKFARENDYAKATPIVRKTMVNLLRSDLKDVLHKVKVPAIIIWGKEDRITPVSDAQIINKKIEKSTLHIISGARHSPMFTHAKKVADIIIKAL